MELLIIIGKTILFYVLLIFILRIMGKREVGELSIFDVVVFFLISELFSLAIDNDTKLIHVLVPIALIVVLQMITSFFALKNDKFRNLIDGKPIIIIQDGKIIQKELKKLRYSIDDLLLQVREHDLDSLENIKFGIIETNGKLSIITYENSKINFPFPVIKDGVLNEMALKSIKKDMNWLNIELLKHNAKIKDVYLALFIDNRLSIIFKESNNEE